jgi:hypothetical protein
MQFSHCSCPVFDRRSCHVRFMVDKVALVRDFSEYFGFPCQSSFHQLLHNHPHISSGAGTIGQKWPQYKGLSPTPLAIKKIDLFSTDTSSTGTFRSTNDLFLQCFIPKTVHEFTSDMHNRSCWSVLKYENMRRRTRTRSSCLQTTVSILIENFM